MKEKRYFKLRRAKWRAIFVLKRWRRKLAAATEVCMRALVDGNKQINKPTNERMNDRTLPLTWLCKTRLVQNGEGEAQPRFCASVVGGECLLVEHVSVLGGGARGGPSVSFWGNSKRFEVVGLAELSHVCAHAYCCA